MNKLTTPIKLLVIATLITIIVSTSATLEDLLLTKPLTIDQYKALEDAIAYNSLKLFVTVLATVIGITLLSVQWYEYLRDRNSDTIVPRPNNIFPVEELKVQRDALLKREVDLKFLIAQQEAERAAAMTMSMVAKDKISSSRKDHPDYIGLAGFYGSAIYELPLSDVKTLVKGHTIERKAIINILLSIYDMPEYKTLDNKPYMHRLLEELKELE